MKLLLSILALMSSTVTLADAGKCGALGRVRGEDLVCAKYDNTDKATCAKADGDAWCSWQPANEASSTESKKIYSADALELANVMKNCAAEVAVLSKMGPANSIASAVHETQEDLDSYTIGFQAGGLAPSFQRYSVGALKISKSFVPSRVHAPDAPGGHFEFTCEITKPAQQE